MGADLYIKSLSEACHKRYYPLFEEAVERRNALREQGKGEEADLAQRDVIKFSNLVDSEGYFRDSYNATSLSQVLGFSWWRDVIPMLNKKDHLPPTRVKKFLELVESRDLPFLNKAFLEAMGCQVDAKGDDSVMGWNQYFLEKRTRLIAFLKKAIELKEPVECSL